MPYVPICEEDLLDLLFLSKRPPIRDPRQAAEGQYSEASRDKWLAKNTKPRPEIL